MRDLEAGQPLSCDQKLWSTLSQCSSAAFAFSSLFVSSLTFQAEKKKTIGTERGKFEGRFVLYDDSATMGVPLWKPMHAEIRSPHPDSLYCLLHLPFFSIFSLRPSYNCYIFDAILQLFHYPCPKMGRVFCKKGCDADGEAWEECLEECTEICYKDPVFKDHQWSAYIDRSPGSASYSEECFHACASGCGFKFDVDSGTADKIQANRPAKPAPVVLKQSPRPPITESVAKNEDLPSTSA